MQYEEMMQQLTALTRRLETEQLSLEEATRLSTQGMELSAKCHRLLEEAVLSVQEIPVPASGNEGSE